MRRLAFLLPLMLVAPVWACMNDRDSDSLAEQAQQFPDTVRIIAGRFERNPPAYYQMRIRREGAELKRRPRQFGIYDDIAVAYDRLQNDEAAIRTMDRKRAALPPFDAKNKPLREAWYRYYANAGTFYVHHWLATGAKLQGIAEAKKGRDFIARAIQIKPKAHFGREKYQLMAMEWLISRREGHSPEETLGNWMLKKDKWDGNEHGEMTKATQGLSGLIVLGAAWQSPDIFQALEASLDHWEGVTLRYLALLRCKELLQSGQKSFAPDKLNVAWVDKRLEEAGVESEGGSYIDAENRASLQKLFIRLRAEANDWSGKREAFMLAQFRQGKHPDTDANFWQGWKPAPPLSLNLNWAHEVHHPTPNEIIRQIFLTLAGGLAFIVAVLVCAFRWFAKRKRTM